MTHGRRNQGSATGTVGAPPVRREGLVLLAIVVLATLAAAAWYWRDAVPVSPAGGIAPVHRVLVEGPFEHVDTTRVEDAVLPHLRGGFFTVDLDAIKAAAESVPWVAAAQVMREWPDRVRIVVIEEIPVWRWGDSGLLNERGELFATGVDAGAWSLPRLDGPDGSEARVVAWYGELNAILDGCRQRAVRVELDARRALRLTLEAGPELKLGGDAVALRARRFCEVIVVELAMALERVAYVDMRYTNGFAVGWRDSGPEGIGG